MRPGLSCLARSAKPVQDFRSEVPPSRSGRWRIGKPVQLRRCPRNGKTGGRGNMPLGRKPAREGAPANPASPETSLCMTSSRGGWCGREACPAACPTPAPTRPGVRPESRERRWRPPCGYFRGWNAAPQPATRPRAWPGWVFWNGCLRWKVPLRCRNTHASRCIAMQPGRLKAPPPVPLWGSCSRPHGHCRPHLFVRGDAGR